MSFEQHAAHTFAFKLELHMLTLTFDRDTHHNPARGTPHRVWSRPQFRSPPRTAENHPGTTRRWHPPACWTLQALGSPIRHKHWCMFAYQITTYALYMHRIGVGDVLLSQPQQEALHPHGSQLEEGVDQGHIWASGDGCWLSRCPRNQVHSIEVDVFAVNSKRRTRAERLVHAGVGVIAAGCHSVWKMPVGCVFGSWVLDNPMR
jgi:hypothetical protein